MTQANRFILSAALWAAATAPTLAFYANGRWENTASGAVGPLGTPITLTWSIVPDNTFFFGGPGQSNLIATLDSWFGNEPGGSDLQQRPWFALFEQCFDRWEELSGATAS